MVKMIRQESKDVRGGSMKGKECFGGVAKEWRRC